MELNNISSFKDFKLMERTIPMEFRNETGFSKSLIGRGLFSILRYFKQGIDLGRLEYLKRKLENEYFAGWLRFCAVNNIDIKEGKLPETEIKVQHDDEEENNRNNDEMTIPKERISNVFEPVFKFDYTKSEDLTRYRKDFENYIKELKTIEVNEDEAGDLKKILDESNLILNMIDLKMEINSIFQKMTRYASQPGIKLIPEREEEMLNGLNKIESFLNNEVKNCENYKLTMAEKNALLTLNKCANDNLVKKCNEILEMVKESINYRGLKLNEEFISSKINTKVPIMQILGDTLNTGTTSKKVNVYEYLKSIGINSVDEINFKACAEIWMKNPSFKNAVSELVSLDGVRKIQYSASRIIFRIKKTPTYTGITPETGGGVNKEEDSALRTAWEKKVELCKGEWTYFMNFEDYKIDPFKAMNIQDAIRDKDSNSNYETSYKNMMFKTSSIDENSKLNSSADKLGLIPVLSSPFKTENELVLMQVQYGRDSELAYILCSYKAPKGNDQAPHIYTYWGNVDLHKIVTDKLYEKPDFKSTLAQKHASSIISNTWSSEGCVKLNNFLDINPGISETGYRVNGYFFGSSDFKRFSTGSSPSRRSTHFMHLFLNENIIVPQENFAVVKANVDINNINLYITNANSKKEKINLNSSTPISNTTTINWAVGMIYKFKDASWGESYFPDWNNISLKKDKLVNINHDIYKDKIKLI